MAGTGAAGPVAAFCAELHRRWQSSGRDLPGVARDVRISRSQLYAILNGEIRRPPDFDSLVRPLILACGGTEAELVDWRRRHEVLTAVHSALKRRPAKPPETSPAPAQLPVGTADFTGRTEELAILDGDAQIMVVSGTAGVGKTALVVHWAHRAAGDFPDGRLYVDLRGFDRTGEVVDPADALRGFLDALGVAPHRVPSGLPGQAALFRTVVAERRLLVVLDNARDTEQVRPLLPAGRNVRTVVTSRDRLTALVAEVGAQPLGLDLPDERQATELFTRRAGRPVPEAAGIVAACGRLPLALALVAARIRQTGFAPPAPEGVRPVFSWSYQALSPSGARLLRHLGLVTGPDIATAAVVALAGLPAPEVRRALRELTEASMVAEHAPGRYQMHDLLRDYAGDLAREHDTEDDRREALARLLDHYTHTAYAADLVLNPARAPIIMQRHAGPPAQFDWGAAQRWLSTERAVLMSALRQARDECLDRQAWQLSWALDTFLGAQGRWQEESTAWVIALRAATALVDRPAAAYAHTFLAVAQARLDRFAEAHAHLREAVELSRTAGNVAGEAETVFVLSYVCWLQSDQDGALEHARRSLALWTELDHPAWAGKAHNAVGWYHLQRDAPREALPHFERAIALEQRAGDRANEVAVIDNLGQARHALGDHEAAAGVYRRGLALARAEADSMMEAQLSIHFGDTCAAIGDHVSARDLWQQAYKILADAGHPAAADVGRKLTAAE
ncbi:MAG TPA: tetratricopeptide repeat protein [Actinoplanes sp.]|nr:tetratricopeptide repeat protein [Actinoplanes sp.]